MSAQIVTSQKDKIIRELDTNIYKILDAYKTLLKKGQVDTQGTVGVHDELQVEAASSALVGICW
jgi:hypothetical protein